MRRSYACQYRRVRYFLSRWVLWRGKPRPARMYRYGRPVDSPIPASERLYFRCMKEWTSQNRQVNPAHIRFPDQSVNREKYSRPTDVLLPDGKEEAKAWLFWGVAAILAKDLPGNIETSGKITYSFTAEHDPLDDNYGHTELRVYKNGARERDKKRINQKVKKRYRTDLALRTRVVVDPLI